MDYDRGKLRKRMREARRALDADERRDADARIRRHILGSAVFSRCPRIGAYLAFDGEPTLGPLIDAARGRGKDVFVPVIRADRMSFCVLRAKAPSTLNHFGIVEPVRPELIDPRSLDLVLTPLVSFDAEGTRLGVGRGYYDRCFAFLRGRRHWLKPKLLGVAYSLQRAPRIASREWDVPLWGVVTERGLQTFAGSTP